MSTNPDPVQTRMAAANPAPKDFEPPGAVLAADVLFETLDERITATPPGTKTRGAAGSSLPRRGWRPAAIAAGVFAVVLVVGVSTLLTTGLLSQPETGAGPSIEWTRVPASGLFEGAWINSVVTGGPGLVAAGGLQVGDDAAVWTSEDGFTWIRVADDGSVFGGSTPPGGTDGKQTIADLAAGPLGLVAVGADGEPGDYDAAVWIARDQAKWQRVPHQETIFGGPGHQILNAIAYGGPGLVAVGESNGYPAVWVSTDGDSWQRIEDDQLTGESPAEMSDVVAGGPGLVAVGGTYSLSPEGYRQEYRASIWVSADGFDWEHLPHQAIASPSRSAVSAVATSTDGLVAVGSDQTPVTNKGAVWISEDGLTWDMVTPVTDTENPTVPVYLSGVILDGDRLVVIGVEPRAPLPPHTAYSGVWVSTNLGDTWQQVGRLDVVNMTGMVNTPVMPEVLADMIAFESQLVAVGVDGYFTGTPPDDYGRPDAAVWIGTWTEN